MIDGYEQLTTAMIHAIQFDMEKHLRELPTVIGEDGEKLIRLEDSVRIVRGDKSGF